MQFKIRDLSAEVQGMPLEQLEAELSEHKAVLWQVTKRVLQAKIENNIMVLQFEKARRGKVS